MTTDTKLQKLIINKLTTSEYSSINEKDPNQLYLVTDALGFDNTITNCLTHIPQDINLELVDGTLTAKQGSRVWIPYGTTEAYQVGDVDTYGNTVVATSWDGSNFFYAIELQSDLTIDSFGTDTDTPLIFIRSDLSSIELFGTNRTFSGATDPDGKTYHTWYDTNNNLVKRYNESASVVEFTCSLPIALGTRSSGVVTSIDQVFNGFGYIGSTIFALPGVRGLIPNGRNADGSLRNIEFEVDRVLTKTYTSSIGAFAGYAAIQTEIQAGGSNIVLSYDALNYWTYNGNKNIFEGQNETTGFCYISKMATDSSGKITSFTPKTTFQAVDRNELKQFELPTGSVIPFAANSNPNGYLICNGAAVNRTTYADLFAVIGTIYGSGDGSTTFNVPNLTDKFIQGSGTVGSVKNAGLPNITGNISPNVYGDSTWLNMSPSYTGALKPRNTNTNTAKLTNYETISNSNGGISFDASRSNPIYGKSSTVQPPALTMRYYIKY